MIKFFTKRMKDNKGFTLVELLIVIAVLGILAAIMVPRMSGITDSFRIKSDIEAAKRIAKEVEVKILAGEEFTDGEHTLADLGEDIDPPEPQFSDAASFTFEVDEGFDYTTGGRIFVGYSNDPTDDIADSLKDLVDPTNDPGNFDGGEVLYTEDIGGKIE